jgi:hypothetical protein
MNILFRIENSIASLQFKRIHPLNDLLVTDFNNRYDGSIL